MAKMGENLIGNRYGKLVVIGVDNVSPGFLVCRCDCGNIKSIRKCNLLKKSGATQSCGCLRKEHGRELGKRMSENLATTRMLSAKYNTNFPNTPTKRVEQGRGYKFNAEGNQMPYLYEIEVSTTEAYDKTEAKQYMRSVIADADKVSADIDSAMINTQVDYTPKFDVNDTFEDRSEERR